MGLSVLSSLVIAGAAVVGLYFHYRNLQKNQKQFEENIAHSQKQFEEQIAQSQKEFSMSLTANHKQARREVALRLWDGWDEKFDTEKRATLLSFLKWIEDENDNAKKTQWIGLFAQGGRVSEQMLNEITPTKVMKEIFLDAKENGKFSLRDVELIRTTLVSFLNTMERVAVAYHFHVADREILDSAFKGNIVKTTTELQILIAEFRKYSHPDTWKPLTDLVFSGEWKQKNKHIPGEASADNL